DGNTCIQPIYSRFDAWASLITSTAVQAASMGQYPVPVWAGGPASPVDAGTTIPPSDAGTGSAEASSNAGIDASSDSSSSASSGSSSQESDGGQSEADVSPPPDSNTVSVGCGVAAAGSSKGGDEGSLAIWALGFAGVMVRRRRRS
ncbi:MAG: hypothetical protein ACREJ3_02800, partial [Polyangiaceae bacterium]